jgi:tetratricopeptide (TPR) repeat protein
MMSAAPDSVTGLQTALDNTNRLLAVDPRLADEQAAEILKVMPDQPNAMMLQALAKGRLHQWPEAVELLRRLTVLQPKWPAAFMELGFALRQIGFGDQAVAAFARAVFLKPDLPKAWLALADLYAAMGETKAADAAYVMQIKHASTNPHLMAVAGAMAENNLAVAERGLKNYLKVYPTDVAAIRMLAEVAARLGLTLDAEHLLARCLELSPGFHFARQNYAHILNINNRNEMVLEQADILLAVDSENLGYLNLKAVAFSKIGDYHNAIHLYEQILAANPGYSKIWHSFGHTLKTAGLTERAIEAYRRSIALEPNFGEAYWSLANLKTFRFTSVETTEMQDQLNSDALSEQDRFHFDFALAKALEDERRYELAFQHYHEGNRRRKALIKYNADRNTLKIKQNKKIFDLDFFEKRAGFGDQSSAPIFILGMPRAGSTLLEQILSSHSQIEGTMELPDVMAFTKELYRSRADQSVRSYYPSVEGIVYDQAAAFGRRYLESTKIHRKADKLHFIDKMPNNYAHIALIHLILPNAKIIDARRHPMACCFSNFKQHFARGQNFSYSLDDMGRYYRDYVELMAHFEKVLPGRVLRVHYENVVADTGREVRRMLEYCDLPFEEGCLRFFENERPVRTASSEQVRQPIYREGVDHWRNFEPWLGSLKEALGPVLECYPEVPDFD